MTSPLDLEILSVRSFQNERIFLWKCATADRHLTKTIFNSSFDLMYRLQKSLLNEKRPEEVIFQLSSAQQSDFQERSSRRVPILQRCQKFLETAASNRRYKYIPPILKFIRAANWQDEWLVSSSAIILPKLNNLYCTILSEVDPSSQQSPGKVNVAISSRVRQDTDAMRALCSVFDICVGFCDLVDEDNQQHLGYFLRTSAAVLFGSDFQKKRDTLNETDYAMDELARLSSYALSNVMLTYPAIVPIAEVILGKRLRCLFNFLHSSPEMSINRSLILMLRSLYKMYESGTDETASKPRKDLIEEEFSYESRDRQSVLHLFRKIDLASEDADAQAENVSLQMHSGDNSEACFKTINCSIQVKEQNGVSRCRVPFRSASIDWNRNSFVVQRPLNSPECWPLFPVSCFEWKKGRNELLLKIDQWSGKSACRIVVRFGSKSASESMKTIIERRLKDIKERINSSENRRPAFSIRKVSVDVMKARTQHAMVQIADDIGQNEGFPGEEETFANRSNPSSRVGVEHILSATAPHSIFSSGSYVAKDNTRKSTPSANTRRFTPAKRGPMSLDTNRTDNDSQCSSPYLEPVVCQSDDYEIEASPALIKNRSAVGGSEKSKHARKTKDSSSADNFGNHCDEKESQGQSEHCDIVTQTPEAGRFDTVTDEKKNPYSQPVVTKPSAGNLVQTESTERKMTVPPCKSKGALHVLTKEDEKLRRKLHSVVMSMLEWKRNQLSEVHQDTELGIKSARERCEKQNIAFLSVFANGVRKRSGLHTKKIATFARQAKEVLRNTRKRLTSLREKLIDGQRQLKILKTKSATDIIHAKESMQEEREGLSVNLDRSVATTRRRGESRARKNSILQSLARILKR